MTFSLTYADLVAGSKAVAGKSPVAKLWRGTSAAALACGAYLAMYSIRDGVGEALLAVGFFAAFVTTAVAAMTLRRGVGVKGSEPVRTTVELTDDGVRQTSEDRTTTMGWPAVREVIATANHLFVVLALRTYIVVPRRAFDDQRSFEEFVKYARQRALAAP